MDDLDALLDELRSDADRRAEFRFLYTGSGDALDALARRVDPSASGTVNPLAEKRALELIVHAPPTDAAGEQRRASATARLQALLESAARDEAALDLAIERYRQRTDEPAAAELAETAEPEVATLNPWPRRLAWVAALAVPLILVGLFTAALRVPDCGAGCAAAPSSAAPTPSPSLTPLLTGYDALWDAYMYDYPDIARPDVALVRVITSAELPDTIVACMNAAGYPGVHRSGSNGIASDTVADDQMGAYNLAMYTCRLQYPTDPLAIFDNPQTPEEKAFEASSAVQRFSPNPGSLRFLVAQSGYTVAAFRLDEKNPEDPLVCLQLTLQPTDETSGGCSTVEDFRVKGINGASGVLWLPNGDLQLTGHPLVPVEAG